MWMFGTVVFVYSLTVHGEGGCASGKYGDGCHLACPENCHVPSNTLLHCKQDNGKCLEGCNDGFYGDRCDQPCSRKCKRHICNQHNAHCTLECSGNNIGDFCEISQGDTSKNKDTTTSPTGVTVHGEEECGPGKYGDRCKLDCPENCRVPSNISLHCKKDSGECFEGCNVGFYGDLCDQPCSKTCKQHICNQHNGHCIWGCIGNHIGVFCESIQGTANDSHTTVTTRVAPTNRSNLKKGDIQVIIPVAVVAGLVLVVSVSTVIICMKWRLKDNPNSNEVEGEDINLMVHVPGNNILHEACFGGDLKLVKSILSRGTVGINSRGHCGRTPIMAAARTGHKHVLKALWRRRCDASLVDDDGNNILHYACIGGHLEVVQCILDKNIIDINCKGKHGMTPVMISVEVGQKHVFDFLLDKGADLAHSDGKGNNILHLACLLGRVFIVKCILSRNSVDIDSEGQIRRTPVMMAAENGHDEVFNELVNAGANLSSIDASGNNILHLGCLGGSEGIVQHILSHKVVDINAMNHDGSKAVTIAKGQGHGSICELLVSQPTK